MTRARTAPFDPQLVLSKVGKGKTTLLTPKKHLIFSQGDAAEAVFYIQTGKVKLTVVSQQGKEAVIAILEPGAFFGQSCLAGQAIRAATATAVEDSNIVRINKDAMVRVLHEEPIFAELFMAYLLAHTIRVEEDLVDQLFNSSEKRLAEMIGTTRSRVSFFMNKFRKLGFIDYNGDLHVHSSLLNVVLHD